MGQYLLLLARGALPSSAACDVFSCVMYTRPNAARQAILHLLCITPPSSLPPHQHRSPSPLSLPPVSLTILGDPSSPEYADGVGRRRSHRRRRRPSPRASLPDSLQQRRRVLHLRVERRSCVPTLSRKRRTTSPTPGGTPSRAPADPVTTRPDRVRRRRRPRVQKCPRRAGNGTATRRRRRRLGGSAVFHSPTAVFETTRRAEAFGKTSPPGDIRARAALASPP